jgi:DNA-binding beta-propeller fold protein YncE
MRLRQIPAIATPIGLFLLGFAADAAEPLMLETRIPLGEVSGRIDHLAYDAKRGRLIVAEFGNNSVSTVDLDRRTVVHRITGLHSPQGVAYLAITDIIYVASAGDGLVRRYKADDFAEAARTDLGDDADNIRVDRATNQVVVGYGSGGLAVLEGVSGAQGTGQTVNGVSGPKGSGRTANKVLDQSKSKRVREGFLLPVHPEGFQLDPNGKRIFVNLASLGEVGVVDRQAGKLAARWRVPGLTSNFPMAIDERGERVLVVYRRPSRLVAFDAANGTVMASLDVCNDGDDVFADGKHRRLYITCGEGVVDVMEPEGASYRRIGRAASVRGARTGLYVPERDRLYVAAPAATGEPAAILVFRPLP